MKETTTKYILDKNGDSTKQRDLVPLKKDLYTSKSISDAWGNKGYVSVGNVTFQSAMSFLG